MKPRFMFSALALGGAALIVGCSNDTPHPIDPARPMTAQTNRASPEPKTVDSKTLLPVQASPAPAAVPAVTTYPAVKPGEVLSAETFLNRDDGRSNDSIASPVKSLEACLNIARERTYANDIGNYYSRSSVTSCIGEDGTARARFSCDKDKTTGTIACNPI